MILFLGLSSLDFFQRDLSFNRFMLLESENLYMKMKIKELEFELESEKIKSRHFEGISAISLIELSKGNWVNSIDRRDRICKIVTDFQNEIKQFEVAKSSLVHSVSKLENFVCSLNAILQ